MTWRILFTLRLVHEYNNRCHINTFLVSISFHPKATRNGLIVRSLDSMHDVIGLNLIVTNVCVCVCVCIFISKNIVLVGFGFYAIINKYNPRGVIACMEFSHIFDLKN